ncbi:MAG: hypothetical protein KDE55_13260, partial [Novosphingobium sp.]|nr:hypothetical protein [Novosphingobium sp.]
MAIDHNELVASSANSLMLVNILRSRDRLPTHYTGISSLTGSASMGAAAGADITIAEGGGEEFAPSLGVSVTGSSSFDVTVYDDREFYQGITGSIPSGTIIHFLDQGWPDDLMTALLTSTVDVIAAQDSGSIRKGDLVGRINNDPDEDGAEPFAQLMACYRLGARTRSGKSAWLMPVDPMKVTDRVYGDLYDGKVEIRERAKDNGGHRFWLFRDGAEERELAMVPHESGCAGTIDFRTAMAAGTTRIDEFDVSLTPDSDDKVSALLVNRSGKGGGGTLKVSLVARIRSAESIVYFLGEYLRKGPAARPRVYRNYGGTPVGGPIIAVTRERPAHVFAYARYEGAMNYIGGVEDGDVQSYARFGRSGQTFTLLQQLINLQKS